MYRLISAELTSWKKFSAAYSLSIRLILLVNEIPSRIAKSKDMYLYNFFDAFAELIYRKTLSQECSL